MMDLFILFICTLPLMTKSASILPVSGSRSKRDAICDHPLQEYETMQFGFDASIIDIYQCPMFAGLRNEVLDLNKCDLKKYWTNTITGEEYNMPDALHAEMVGSRSEKTNIYQKWTEWYAHFRSVINIEDEYSNGLMALSERGLEIQSRLANGTRFVVSVKNNVDYKLQLDLSEARKLVSPAVKKAFSDLPDKFVGSEAPYIEFIRQFGTHIITKGEFGALIERTVQMKGSDIDLTDEELKNKWKKSFPSLNDADKEICRNHMSRKTSIIVNDVDNYTEILIGGDVQEIRSKGFDAYWKNVARNPKLRGARLRSISLLVDGPKSNELKMAIETYMTKAALDRDVKILRNLLETGFDATQETHSIFSDYDLVKNYDNYNQKEINNLYDRTKTLVSEMVKNREEGFGGDKFNGAANVLMRSLTLNIVIVGIIGHLVSTISL